MLRCRPGQRERGWSPSPPSSRESQVSWPSPAAARWSAGALFMLALSLHLFLALGGTLAGIDLYTLIIVDEIGAILLAPLVVATVLRVPFGEAFALRSSHWSHWIAAGAAALPLQVLGGAMQELVIEAMPNSETFRELIERALEPLLNARSAWDMALLMLGAVVLAAVCEELLFRGLMMRLLTQGGHWRGAIVATAVAFSVFHLDPVGLLPRTLMGVYFGLLVWRSGSIFPAILAHGLNNMLALSAAPFMDVEAAPLTMAEAALLAVISGVIFAGVLAVWWRWAPPRPASLSTTPLPEAPVRPDVTSNDVSAP